MLVDMEHKTLPDGWKSQKLASIATINYGKSPQGIIGSGENFPIVGTGGVERFGDDYLYDGESIILGRKGTIDKVAYVSGRFWAIDTTYYLSNFRDIEVKWLHYFLQLVDFRMMNEATGVPSLSRDYLYKVDILKPTPEEQTQIANIISTIDKAIEQTEAIIEKQNRIKNGLMQDLLTKGIDEHGNIRSEKSHEFKDSPAGRISVEWETDTLGKIAIFHSGYAFKNEELTEFGWKVVRISNLHKPDFPYWHYTGPIKRSWVINRGDILFTWAGVASSIDCVRYEGEEALINQHIYNLKISDKSMKHFVYHYLNRHLPFLRREIEGGAGQLHLTKPKIQAICIPKLPTGEMKSIVTVLDTVDSAIRKEHAQYHKLHRTKIGLMRDLLTGRVPVTNLLNRKGELTGAS